MDTEDEYIESHYIDWLHKNTTPWQSGCAELAISAFRAGWEAARSYSEDLPPWTWAGEDSPAGSAGHC